MVDGVALLASLFHGMSAAGFWIEQRGDNLLDGGAPFYRTYATSDGEAMAVAALEPQFFAELLVGLGLEPSIWRPSTIERRGPSSTAVLAEVFASEPRSHWEQVFDGTDACVSPVRLGARSRPILISAVGER